MPWRLASPPTGEASLTIYLWRPASELFRVEAMTLLVAAGQRSRYLHNLVSSETQSVQVFVVAAVKL